MEKSQIENSSAFFKVLCFITLIVSLGYITGSFIGIKKVDDMIEERMMAFQNMAHSMNLVLKDVPGYSIAQDAVESIRSTMRTAFYSLISLSFLSVLSIFMLLKRKKIGFYLYAFAQILISAGMIYGYLVAPDDFRIYLLLAGIVSFVFIVLFSLKLKNLH